MKVWGFGAESVQIYQHTVLLYLYVTCTCCYYSTCGGSTYFCRNPDMYRAGVPTSAVGGSVHRFTITIYTCSPIYCITTYTLYHIRPINSSSNSGNSDIIHGPLGPERPGAVSQGHSHDSTDASRSVGKFQCHNRMVKKKVQRVKFTIMELDGFQKVQKKSRICIGGDVRKSHLGSNFHQKTEDPRKNIRIQFWCREWCNTVLTYCT